MNRTDGVLQNRQPINSQQTFVKGVDTFQRFIHNLVSPVHAVLNTGAQ